MDIKEMLKTLGVIIIMMVVISSTDNELIKILMAFTCGDYCSDFKMFKGRK